MGRSFDDIQRVRRRASMALFGLLAFFYLLSFGLLWLGVKMGFSVRLGRWTPLGWSLRELLIIGLAATAAALAHWFGSVGAGMDRILSSLGATAPDPKDRYHRALVNVVEEVRLAAGMDDVGVVVVPAPAMNAFSVTDLSGRSVIGFTEGLVSRLSRAQLQAVAAHEMAHVREGDNVVVTMACSLFGVFAQMLAGLEAARRGRDRRGDLLYPVLLAVTLGAYLLNVMISRQREYLADATAVELTRDPVALAEALRKIGRSAGGGVARHELAPLFIVNPESSRLSESSGILPDLFSTHPPLFRRIRVLLSMAHVGWTALEQRLSKEEGAVPALSGGESASERTAGGGKTPLWIAYHEGNWHGPFDATDLIGQPWVNLATPVAAAGSAEILPLGEVPVLAGIFRPDGGRGLPSCPLCRMSLLEREYEGICVRQCPACKGFLLERGQDFRILNREEATFSEETRRRADLFKAGNRLRPGHGAPHRVLEESLAYPCPVCRRPMRRQIFNYQYFVEVDRCSECGLTWFDTDELEILQMLVEEARSGASGS